MKNQLFNFLLSLSKKDKLVVMVFIDIALCLLATWLALIIRLDTLIILNNNFLITGLVSIFIAIPIFVILDLYKTLFRYSGKFTITLIAFCLSIYTFIYFVIVAVFTIDDVPRSLGILQPIILFLLMSSSRLIIKKLIQNQLESQTSRHIPNVLIYGAGKAGRELVSAIDASKEMNVIGFLDDDNLLQGQFLFGRKIFNPEDLKNIIKTKNISNILYAIPSLGRQRRSEILKKISHHKIKIKALPSLLDLIDDKITVNDIKEVNVLDILDRTIVPPNEDLLKKNIYSKIVMVTGAGGSIGSELCRQIVSLKPKKLLLLDINEFSLYNIYESLNILKKKIKSEFEIEIISFLSSVLDVKKISEIIKSYKPNTIYHAAAYKHVPIVEENVSEGVKNNVYGTLNVAIASVNNQVDNFVLISSDKAVRPTNVMGASKRLSELCLQALNDKNQSSNTKLSMVRFGNVLNSSGSVIPLFKKQIKEGGPVTLTHENVSRYFMTIPEAAQLVIQAGSMAKGGDVFILDMGKPVKIKNVIEKMINLSGLSVKNEKNVLGDIEIKIIGLRPGEKLHEELLLGDNPKPTMHLKIQKAEDEFIKWDILNIDIDELKEFLLKNDVENIIKKLTEIVKGYNHNGKIYDILYLKNKKN